MFRRISRRFLTGEYVSVRQQVGLNNFTDAYTLVYTKCKVGLIFKLVSVRFLLVVRILYLSRIVNVESSF